MRETVTAELGLSGAYAPTGEQAGKRDLANLLLAYGVHADSDAAEVALVAKFRQARNMTDREFAFRLILREMPGSAEAEEATGQFYRMFRNDPIVIDKWFTAQAMVPGRTAVSTCRRLTQHEAFSWTNPNRVRSVLTAFATANPTGFNRADGSGYRFVADAVAKLDGINPQIAARMLTAFRSWRMLEAERRGAAEQVLRSLRRRAKHSRDVSEILDRVLS